MSQVRGGTHYLLLKRTADGRHDLACYERFQQAVSGWDRVGTRISPIFSVNEAAALQLRADQKAWVVLCGPVFPGDVDQLEGVDLYLTLGLFNVLMFCRSADKRDSAVAFIKQYRTNGEIWHIDGFRITQVQVLSNEDGGAPFNELDLTVPFPKDSALCATGREYITLIAESVARASRFTPTAAKELLQFDRIFRGKVLPAEHATPVKQGLLTTANAALSRYTSQTYAGTSPVSESACHCWNNSLFGIGIPSLALVQIRRFVEQAVEDTRLIDRVMRLKESQPARALLQSLPPDEPLWSQDLLAVEFPKEDPAQHKLPVADDPRIHLLTYLSGRDGFRASYDIALSAPLELLESCNSITWTLLTITHEISHILVDGVLGLLLPNPHNDDSLAKSVATLKKANTPANLFEQMQHLIVYGAWAMNPETVSEERVTTALLAHVLALEGKNLYEIVTHCFDFLYFYKGNADIYIPSVWASWSVIPYLEDRIPEYLVRSLCALLTQNLRREKGIQITIDQLSHLLKRAREEHPTALYIPQAIEALEANQRTYIDLLSKRRPLVLFSRHFLYSPAIEKRLLGEDTTAEFKSTEFTQERVANPLRFIHDFSREKKADHIRACWVLQQLAFGGPL